MIMLFIIVDNDGDVMMKVIVIMMVIEMIVK